MDANDPGNGPTSGLSQSLKKGLPAEAIIGVKRIVSMYKASGLGLSALLVEIVAAFETLKCPGGATGSEDGQERSCPCCARRFYPCRRAADAARKHGLTLRHVT